MIPEPRTIPDGLASLVDRFEPPPLPPGNAPVFLFASAWRSGSTLVQRLLVSGGELLMWGEPYDHSTLVRRMAESLIPFSEKWPPVNYIVDPEDPPTAERWIANAYPSPADLLAAHRAFFDRLFSEPAAAAGFSRWGFKGVRLGGEHALYLKRIYPDARFIFLHRNPYDAFLSYRMLHEIRTHSYWWYHRWPDEQVATAEHFGAIWSRLTESFIRWAPEVGGTVVAYEDLTRGSKFSAIADAADVPIDESILESKVGGTRQQRGEWDRASHELTATEMAGLRETAGRLGRALGYVGPSTGGIGS